MYQRINEHDFIDAFRTYGRLDHFSIPGLKALFEYLESIEEDIGQEFELDVISLCGDFAEYKDLEEIRHNYPEIETMEDLYNNTIVIEFDGGIIIQGF